MNRITSTAAAAAAVTAAAVIAITKLKFILHPDLLCLVVEIPILGFV